MIKKEIEEMSRELDDAMRVDSQLTDLEKEELLIKAKGIMKRAERMWKHIDRFNKLSEGVALYFFVPFGVVSAFWGTVLLLNNYRADYLAMIGSGIGLFLLGISYFLDSKNFIKQADSFIMFASVSAFAISFMGISFRWLNPELWISIVVFSTVICLIQFIKIGIAALYKSVRDPKDRLTIIVAIIGSLIALIALFK